MKSSMADGAEAPKATTFHKDFNSADADITVVSSDNIAFRLHSKFVQSNNAQGLQVAVENAKGRSLPLEEPASILEILFAFLYPRRVPSIAGLSFTSLLQLAEGAEKYKIFNAAGICELRLLAQISSHPKEMLCFGLKHNYPEFINQAAIHLSRVQQPLDEILDDLPDNVRITWVRYDQSWKLLFRSRRNYLQSNVNCENCFAVLSMWWEEIEAMPMDKLSGQKELSQKWMEVLISSCRKCLYRFRVGPMTLHQRTIESVLESLSEGVNQVPTFTAHMETRGMQAKEVKQLAEFKVFTLVSGQSQARSNLNSRSHKAPTDSSGWRRPAF